MCAEIKIADTAKRCSLDKKVIIIGGGLAGSEAALSLAEQKISVELYEMKPLRFSPAHSNPDFAELVCSNSFKSDDVSTAGGLIKAELRLLKSPLIEIADSVKVPAGSALAVDRALFARAVTERIEQNPYIRVIHGEVTQLDDKALTVVATGPLTSDGLFGFISAYTGAPLHFYDAAAPIVAGDSIDMAHAFTADRYGRGNGDYINCPLNKDEYAAFYEALVSAERVILHQFEKAEIYENCMPVEVMAGRGFDTLRFGPLRPVGFSDSIGKRPCAVVQLRRENAAGDMYNIVGFQTNLKFNEQKRVFSLIPALKNAEYLRYGVMHRNSFIDAPKVLDGFSRLKKNPNIYIAGQLSGVEGYVESILSGRLCAYQIVKLLNGEELTPLPVDTVSGALTAYLATSNERFQPMNANFGILPPLSNPPRDKKLKKEMLAARALESLKNFLGGGR